MPHRGRHRRRSSLRWYVRRRLRRRLFVWFGVSILLSVVLAAGMMWALSPTEQWRRHVDDVQTFVSGRFARVWDEPAERDELAQAVADDLKLGVRLTDLDDEELGRFGPDCEPAYHVPILRDGSAIGEASFCLPEQARGPGPMWLALFAGVIVLWGVSGVVAHRLTRPLWRLVEATRAVGAGQLDVDIALGPHEVDELAELAGAIRDMLARIRKQIDDQRELLAAVSHEIRTPLGHLRVLVDLARERGADERRLQEIDAEVVAIDRLVGQLVASSRVDFGTLDRRRLDAVELAVHALDRAGLDPTLLEATHERIEITGDAALLGQALANLLSNAQEHGGGVTGLRVEQGADTVRFEVDDDGPGFGDMAGDPFAAFARGSRPRGGSLGLGLSLVRRIAEAHDGTAWAVDRPEGGASVGLSCRLL